MDNNNPRPQAPDRNAQYRPRMPVNFSYPPPSNPYGTNPYQYNYNVPVQSYNQYSYQNDYNNSYSDPNYSYTMPSNNVYYDPNYYSYPNSTYYPSNNPNPAAAPASGYYSNPSIPSNHTVPPPISNPIRNAPPNQFVKQPQTKDTKYSNYSATSRLDKHEPSRDNRYHRTSRSSIKHDSRHTSRPRNTSSSRSEYNKIRTTVDDKKLNSSNEREVILERWRKNYCSTKEEMSTKLQELSRMSQEDVIEREKSIWTRTTPADLYYTQYEGNKRNKIMIGTKKLQSLCEKFNENLVLRRDKVNSLKPKYEPPQRENKTRFCKHKSEHVDNEDSSSEEDCFTDEEENIMEELSRKQQHPDRLHPEMWYNDPGEMNDGPLCRCSLKSRKSGIRHGIYAGEKFIKMCNKNSNNSDKLYHYRITISPPTNFLTKTPTIIQHDEHEFIFEGFSMFSHFPLVKLPTCKVIRFNIEYTILYIEEKHPDNFTIQELDLFSDFLFKEILELVDLDFRTAGDKDGCAQFHFMPRFVRDLPDNGREILSMNEVLEYLLHSSKILIDHSELDAMVQMSQYEWQSLADDVKGMVVTYPGKKPCSVRVDQLDRNSDLQIPGQLRFPEIVHFGIRPPQLSYAGNPEYQKAWRDYVKFRHLLANMSKPTYEDKRKLEIKENKLQEMRTKSKMKRDVTVAVSAEGFYRTGIMCDIVQHAMLIPVLVCHLRFHHSLNVLEEQIGYNFENRSLLQLAMTHPSYRENFGTNPDHARNSLTNCGIRQPEYGDRRIHYMNTRKRGINTLINIMSRFGKEHETESNITHNERLEFLGDAVVEFLSSIHLFKMFPQLEEGGLATYRAAIVQNQHLAVLAGFLYLDQYMLYAHGSDLCHDLELRHAMANCFEALMGALFLDGGIEVADKVFGRTFFCKDNHLLGTWEKIRYHPLQEQEPYGDRGWISKFEFLQKLTKFEGSVGIQFTHIRLLARAFTDRSIGFNNLTLGSNQRLEFLGDTVLQLIASEYLYKFFPEHHEGHLSLLRSSLVNNRTQAVVCNDLGMAAFAVYHNPKAELKTKDRADLLEAFIGALYIDKGMVFCRKFCEVTLFPRLQDFIMNQDWNDPKSKLQQCCLTLRTMDGGEPDIPVYKVIECKGPTNTRVYTVAVYFRGRRLADATGHSIQQAEMNSAMKALERSHDLFPQLDHQKRVIAKSMKKQKHPNKKRSNKKQDSNVDTDNRPSGTTHSKYRRDKSKSPSYDMSKNRRSRQFVHARNNSRSRSKSRSRVYNDSRRSRSRSSSYVSSTSTKRNHSPRKSRSRSPSCTNSQRTRFPAYNNKHERSVSRFTTRSIRSRRSRSKSSNYSKSRRSRSRSPFYSKSRDFSSDSKIKSRKSRWDTTSNSRFQQSKSPNYSKSTRSRSKSPRYSKSSRSRSKSPSYSNSARSRSQSSRRSISRSSSYSKSRKSKSRSPSYPKSPSDSKIPKEKSKSPPTQIQPHFNTTNTESLKSKSSDFVKCQSVLTYIKSLSTSLPENNT